MYYVAPPSKDEKPPEDNTDYLQKMIDCCVSGNADIGNNLEVLRNEKIKNAGSLLPEISYHDLEILSKIIQNEAGSDWLPMSWKIKVGEVFLNRIASPEFPNTADECLSSKNSYDIRYNGLPSTESVTAAAKLLSGERIINDPSVVFQANFKQGSGIYEVLHDDILGDTYLCYSSYPELYEIQ